MSQHNETGKKGEQLAAQYLRQSGYTILHCNWRHSRYEIDIIATHSNILHFIEVKTRTTNSFGMPEESVSTQKLRHLLKAGAAFQYRYPQYTRVQYDVLSISYKPEGQTEYFLIEDVYL